MRQLPDEPEKVFKNPEETLKRVAYINNLNNKEFFNQELEYRKDQENQNTILKVISNNKIKKTI